MEDHPDFGSNPSGLIVYTGSGHVAVQFMRNGRPRWRNEDDPTDAERAKFKKAATEFESFFLYYMMKTMRQAIPKGGLMDSKVGDTYLGLFDQEVAKQAAKQGGFGLAKTLESQMFPPPPGRSSFPSVPPIKSTEKEGS